MVVRCRVPLTISLCGEGTDNPDYAYENGGEVLSTSINYFVYGSVSKRKDKRLVIHYLNEGKSYNFSYPLGSLSNYDRFRFAAACFKRFYPETGRDVVIYTNAPDMSGFTESPSVNITIMALMLSSSRKAFTLHNLAEESYTLAKDLLYQKQCLHSYFSAVFGGLRRVSVEHWAVTATGVDASHSVLREFELASFLCFPYEDFGSHEFLNNLKRFVSKADTSPFDRFHTHGELLTPLLEALARGGIDDIRALLDVRNGYTFEALSDEGIQVVQRVSEVSGGAVRPVFWYGGGFLLVVCGMEGKKRAMDNLSSQGFRCVDFCLDGEGFSLWYPDTKKERNVFVPIFDNVSFSSDFTGVCGYDS